MATQHKEVLARTPERDELLTGLGTSFWKLHLCQLYLSTGRAMPDDVKAKGVFFSFCDEQGHVQPKATATHIGWTVGADGGHTS